ncbi:hypothetical protein [Streptomyces hirsutus]|uniref:hypothetical protein n=1 Tax=Streptomyces hirsutus TaxID=35620 RepID=UPI00332E9812
MVIVWLVVVHAAAQQLLVVAVHPSSVPAATDNMGLLKVVLGLPAAPVAELAQVQVRKWESQPPAF